MPRKARIDAPGALHHIIGRGIHRQEIFTDKSDYERFLDRLGDLLVETKTSCYAWALLPNHFHLLLKTGNVPVATVMARLLTGYAVNFNRRQRRFGHLFQNRYKSILCQEEPYLLELVRYIHLNPLRAELVQDYKDLRRHSYCGHGVILGHWKNDWQNVNYILGLFGDKPARARRRYGEFVRKGIAEGRRKDLIGGGLLRSHGGWAGVKALKRSGAYQKGDERILGDGDFVKEVLSQANEQLQRKYRIQAEGYDLNRLIDRVAEITELSAKEILDHQRNRKRTQARSILCFWAHNQLGISQPELARILHLTQSAICQAIRRGSALVEAKAYTLFND